MTWPTVSWQQVVPVSSAEVRAADAAARERYGIEPIQLMEVAGWQVARVAEAFLKGASAKRILVVAGSGNNGGDALCAARFLKQRGALVHVSLVPSRDPASLASHHAATLASMGAPIDHAPARINGDADLIIDGLLGTGIRPPLRAPAPYVIDAIKGSGRPVIAIDVPSGMDADDASGAEQAVHATLTVTLAAPKPGLARAPNSGRILLADIGMPLSLFSTARESLEAAFRLGDLVELTLS